MKGGGKNDNQLLTLAARVMLRSFITSSNAAVSSACFWLCKAIFSLNFRGLLAVAMIRSSAPFSFNGQRQVTLNEEKQRPVWAAFKRQWTVTAISFRLQHDSPVTLTGYLQRLWSS